MRKLIENKPLLIMLIAVVLLGILAFVSAGERSATAVENVTGGIIQPVQTFAAKASNGIIGFFQRIFKTTDADKALAQMEIKMAQLETAQNENERLKAENERLKGLLNYVSTLGDYGYVTATVIGNSQGIWFEVFTINAGRNKGIEKNMAVVNRQGLVGKVIEVGANWSKVMSVIDASSEVSVMVERTRDAGIVRGMFNVRGDNSLELFYLPSGFDLVPGDVIVTSGMSSIYPKGIAVGTVSEVIRQTAGENGDSRNAIIEPGVDFGHLEEVLVVVSAEQEGKR